MSHTASFHPLPRPPHLPPGILPGYQVEQCLIGACDRKEGNCDPFGAYYHCNLSSGVANPTSGVAVVQGNGLFVVVQTNLNAGDNTIYCGALPHLSTRGGNPLSYVCGPLPAGSFAFPVGNVNYYAQPMAD